MTKTKTTAALLTLAAAYVHDSRNPRNGFHIDIVEAINNAALEHKFRNAVFVRAMTVFDMLFTNENDKRRHMFGKQVSESRDEHAIIAVGRNCEHRMTALLMAAEVSKTPIRKRVKRAVTAPSIKVAPTNNAFPPTSMAYNQADICR